MMLDIQKLVNQPCDYSQEFDDTVEECAHTLAAKANVIAFHDHDMNYSAAQTISVFFNDDGVCVSKNEEPSTKVDFLLSSKGPVFTRVILYRATQRAWNQGDDRGLKEETRKTVGRLQDTLKNYGWTYLPKEILNEYVEGRRTELDSSPATLFEVLFSEKY